MSNQTRQYRTEPSVNSAAELKAPERALRTDFMPRPASHAPQPALPSRMGFTPRRMLFVVAFLALAIVGWGAKTTLFPKSAANLVTAPVTSGDIDQIVLAT